VDKEQQFEGQKFLLPEIFGDPREEDIEQEHDGWISLLALSKCFVCLLPVTPW
jgi:hypothetical protein